MRACVCLCYVCVCLCVCTRVCVRAWHQQDDERQQAFLPILDVQVMKQDGHMYARPGGGSDADTFFRPLFFSTASLQESSQFSLLRLVVLHVFLSNASCSQPLLARVSCRVSWSV